MMLLRAFTKLFSNRLTRTEFFFYLQNQWCCIYETKIEGCFCLSVYQVAFRVSSNSAIHKAAGSLVTDRSQKYRWQERPPEAVPLLTASRLEQWNDGIVQGKSWNGREP